MVVLLFDYASHVHANSIALFCVNPYSSHPFQLQSLIIVICESSSSMVHAWKALEVPTPIPAPIRDALLANGQSAHKFGASAGRGVVFTLWSSGCVICRFGDWSARVAELCIALCLCFVLSHTVGWASCGCCVSLCVVHRRMHSVNDKG